MLPISTYLNETSTFTHELAIRVNSETYIDRIIAFEQVFLTLGEEYGFFVAVPFKQGIHLSLTPLLDKYEKERHISLEQRKTEALTLMNFSESKYPAIGSFTSASTCVAQSSPKVNPSLPSILPMRNKSVAPGK